MKNTTQLNTWIWRWHCIAGLITLPFMLLLSITGSLYLFKHNYEENRYADIKSVTATNKAISYQQQWQLAQAASETLINKLVLPENNQQATEFSAGRFSNKQLTYVDPYQGKVTGQIVIKDTLMQKIRKLHGELLLGKYGTKVIEWVASWAIVLVISGLILFWPKEKFNIKAFFIIRFNQGKRKLYRDLHSVISFWISLVLLIILAGGMPWTDVFGSNYKSLRDATQSGYPEHWSNSKGLTSTLAAQKLDLDDMVNIANAQNLAGMISITLPSKVDSVFSVSNRAENLNDQVVRHFDQYSGELVKSLTWQDVGIMSAARQVVMRLHQGEFFGFSNWLIILFSAIALSFTSVFALLMYLKRKRKGKWSIPSVPKSFVVGNTFLVSIVILGLVFPLFGLSVITILVLQWLGRGRKNRTLKPAVD